MPRLFWSADAGPAGNQLGLMNDAGQLPARSTAREIDPSDVVYPAPGGGTLRVPVGGGAAAPVNGSANGQLWFYDQTAGLWLPTPTAPADGDVPLWNATANTWSYTPLPGLGAIRYFDNTFSPAGLWNFNGTTADANGVASNDLSLVAGNTGFCDITPGKLGLYVFSGSRYETAGPSAPLLLQGDMSFFAIVQQDNTPPSEQPVARYTGAGETEAANAQWSLSFPTATSPVSVSKRLQYLSEHGAGIDDSVTSGGNVSLPPLHNIALVGWTRIAGVIQFFYNGLPFGPASAPIAAPTGGTDASMRLFVGANTSATTAVAPYVLFCMQAIPSGLTPTQVKQLYNLSMGPAFGLLTLP